MDNLISREVLSDGFVQLVRDVVELPPSPRKYFEMVRHRGAAAVLPVMRANDRPEDSIVFLIRQYRHAVRGPMLEIPAGLIDHGEAPVATAERELREETGLSAGNLEPIGKIHPTPGYSDEIIHLYVATVLVQGESDQDPNEDIQVVKTTLGDALVMVGDGDITDSKTVVALLRAKTHLEKE